MPARSKLTIGFCVAAFAAAAIYPFWRPDITGAGIAVSVLLGLALCALTVIDIETLRLPDVLTLPLIAAGCVASIYLTLDDLTIRIAAALAGFLSLFLIAEVFRRLRGVDALGMGDAKLFAAGGAWVGFDGLSSVLLLASVSALAFAGVAILAGSEIRRDTRIPFGPFLAGAIWIVWLYGPLPPLVG